jgi:hypothetical protein
MIRYECDRCGARLGVNDAGRYILRMEIFAAAGPVELNLESTGDPGDELSRLIRTLSIANPDEVEDRTYRSFRFDLCDDCRKKMIQRPLG